jgi:hypothetical protein
MGSIETIETSRVLAPVNCRQKPETLLGMISGYLEARTKWW